MPTSYTSDPTTPSITSPTIEMPSSRASRPTIQISSTSASDSTIQGPSSPDTNTIRRKADFITYRFEKELVYVKPEANYNDAIDIAIKEFSILSEVDRERVSLSTIATMPNNNRMIVRISESAWGATSARLLRGEVVDVSLRPPLEDLRSRSVEFLAPPPQYEDEKSGYCSAPDSRAPSPAPSERSRRPFLERLLCHRQ